MPEENKAPEKIYPARIKLTRPHGFLDEENRERSWKAGTVISSADEIALLVDRGAQHEVF